MSFDQTAPSFVVVVLDRRKKPCGMGILVTSDTVITCAHVINEAIGQSITEIAQPSEDARVNLTFPFSGHTRKATVHDWGAPGKRSSRSDFCLLRLNAAIPEDIKVARFASTRKATEFRC